MTTKKKHFAIIKGECLMVTVLFEYNGNSVEKPSTVPHPSNGSILLEGEKSIHEHADSVLCPVKECKDPRIKIVVGFAEPAGFGARCVDFCHSEYVDAVNEKLPMKWKMS